MRFFNSEGGFLITKDRLTQNYKLVCIFILVSFFSVSCGKKGPLYISTKDAEIINKQPIEMAKPESKKEPGTTPTESTK